MNPHSKVMEILELMHLQTFFSCSGSIEEALAQSAGNPRGSVFPRKLSCPVCDKGLRAEKPGRFRCPGCKTVLVVDGSGNACL